MKLGIIGTGYVGLVSGVCFAENGNQVICMDLDSQKIKRLKKGDPVIYEPQLEELLRKNIDEKRITFTTSLKETVQNSDIVFLCLPTPPNEDGSVDVQHILKVSKEIAKFINKYKIIVSKSTAPVGTCEKIREIISSKTKIHFDIVSNPEFLKEGAAVNDFMSPDRVVIGTGSKKASEIMQSLYNSFMRVSERLILMDERSAELTKYAANSMLALRISFINEIAGLCEKLGADIKLVRTGIGTDPRIGNSFLFPSLGYGGSCLPKDIKGLIKTAESNGYDLKIVKAADEVNEAQKKVLISKIKLHYKNKLNGKVFSLWGLSYKPRTDDVRESPSIRIAEELLKSGALIHVFDPAAMENFKTKFKNRKGIKFFNDNYSALKNSDGLILVTEWNEFRNPDIEKMKSLMRRKVVFDGRNIYNPKTFRARGFSYYGIGM